VCVCLCLCVCVTDRERQCVCVFVCLSVCVHLCAILCVCVCVCHCEILVQIRVSVFNLEKTTFEENPDHLHILYNPIKGLQWSAAYKWWFDDNLYWECQLTPTSDLN